MRTMIWIGPDGQRDAVTLLLKPGSGTIAFRRDVGTLTVAPCRADKSLLRIQADELAQLWTLAR